MQRRENADGDGDRDEHGHEGEGEGEDEDRDEGDGERRIAGARAGEPEHVTESDFAWMGNTGKAS
jgi:hypothetical protein